LAHTIDTAKNVAPNSFQSRVGYATGRNLQHCVTSLKLSECEKGDIFFWDTM